MKDLRKKLNHNKGLTCLVFSITFYGFIVIQHIVVQKVHIRRNIEIRFISIVIDKLLSFVYNFTLGILYFLPAIILSLLISLVIIYFYIKINKK